MTVGGAVDLVRGAIFGITTGLSLVDNRSKKLLRRIEHRMH